MRRLVERDGPVERTLRSSRGRRRAACLKPPCRVTLVFLKGPVGDIGVGSLLIVKKNRHQCPAQRDEHDRLGAHRATFGGSGPQPQRDRPRLALGPIGRDRRRQRRRQEFARLRHACRRGTKTLRRNVFHSRAPLPGSCRTARRRVDRRHSSGDFGRGEVSKRSERSTVATVIDIHDHLAILYARIGRVHCLKCDAEVLPADPTAVDRAIEALPAQTRYMVAYPLEILADTDPIALGDSLRESGFVRVRVDEATIALANAPLIRPMLSKTIEVIVDRLVRGGEDLGRRRDSIETAFDKGLGRCALIVENVQTLTFSRQGWLSRCGTVAIAPNRGCFRSTALWARVRPAKVSAASSFKIRRLQIPSIPVAPADKPPARRVSARLKPRGRSRSKSKDSISRRLRPRRRSTRDCFLNMS